MENIDGIYYNECTLKLIATDEKANFHKLGSILGYTEAKNDSPFANQYHLYILSEEKIKLGDWFYNGFVNLIQQATEEILSGVINPNKDGSRKIIASTDDTLKTVISNPNDFDTVHEMPGIPKKFIDQYVKSYCNGSIITSVHIEYDYKDIASWSRNENDTYDCFTCGKEDFDKEEDCNCEFYTLVINSENNTISTLVIDNKVYTRDDMIRAYTQGVKDYCGSSLSIDSFMKEEFPKWIKNL
jgi:hypothetical protein